MISVYLLPVILGWLVDPSVVSTALTSDSLIDEEEVECRPEKIPCSIPATVYTLELTALPDIITTNPLLYIPPNVLKPSSLYKLSLTVTANGFQGTDSINVTVSSSRCTPYIHGGNRNISTNGIILLNASIVLNPHHMYGLVP